MSRSKSTFRAIAITGMLLLGGLAFFPSPAGAVWWVKNDMGIPYNTSVSSGLYGVAVGDGNRDDKLEVYFNCYDNAHVYQYAYINKMWDVKDLGTLGRGTQGNAVLVGDADDDGKLEVYATALVSSSYNVYVYQLAKTDNGWARTEMGVGGYYRSDIDIGDGNNDNRTELFSTDTYYGIMSMFSKGGSWNSQQIGTTPVYNYYGTNYNAYLWGVAVGDADNDGSREVYGAAGDNHIYRWRYTGLSWNRTDLGTGEPRSDFWNGMRSCVIGDADNDGRNEIYGASYFNGTIWRYKWNSGNSTWGITKLVSLGGTLNANDICIGDGNSDGQKELYVAASNRQVYQVALNQTTWEYTSVGSGNAGMNGVSIGKVTGDPQITEIYAACGDGHAYQFYMDSIPPANPLVSSDTHPVPGTWYTKNIVHVMWKDVGGDISGIDGYSFAWDNSPGTIPDDTRDLQETVKEATSPPLGDGSWYFHIRARDNALNWNLSATHFGPINIDTTAPDSVAVSINGGADYTNNNIVTLSVAASDPMPGSGIAYASFSNDGNTWSDWESFSATRAGWDLTDAKFGGTGTDGNKTVSARVKDLVGFEIDSRKRAADSIFLDRVAPSDLAISINDGAQYATSSDVKLAVKAWDPEPASGLWKMSFSNDGINWSEWMDWSGSAAWSLTTGAGGTDTDGQKIVYFRLEDRALNIGGPVRAAIFLDRLAPGQLGVLINDGAAYTSSATVSLAISASDPDPGSQLSEMTLANEPDKLGTWESFASSKGSWSLISGTGGTDTDGQKAVYLQVRDKAGNIGGPVKGTIFLDRVKPSGLGIMINSGAAYTLDPSVYLLLRAADADPSSGINAMQFSDDGVKWTEWEQYIEKRQYTLPGPDGPKTVYFRVRDYAGNVADIAKASIILDTAQPVISNVRVVGLTDNSAMITWTTDEEANSGVDFGLTVSYGSSLLDPSFVTSHSIALKDLNPTTTYHFRVSSADRAGNKPAFSQDLVFTTSATPDTTPPSISAVLVSGITDNLAVVSWSTSEAADSSVDFGFDTNYGQHNSDAGYTLLHALILSGLKGSTTYHFKVSSRDPSGNGPTFSSDYTFTTEAQPDRTPPVISNLKVSGVTDKLAVITWETDEPADGMADFGPTADYGKTTGHPGLLTVHEITITNLAPMTKYHLRVRSTDASGNGPTFSADLVFETTAAPDIVPPVMSNVRADGVTETSAIILWDTDEISDSFVEFGLSSSFGLSSADGTNTLRHSVLLQGLEPDKTYHFRVRSTDPSMNAATGTEMMFRTKKTPVAPDTTPPKISGVQVTGITNTRAVVVWQTDEVADSSVDYGNSTAYGQKSSDGSFVAMHSILLDNLEPSTVYHIRVRSTDIYGNGPAVGQDVDFTTDAGPDTTPPAISGLRVANETNVSAVISWQTSEAAEYIIEFGLDALYGHNITSHVFLTNQSVTLANLTPGKLYHFRVTAKDTSGNLGTSGADLTFKTKTKTVTPTPKPFADVDASWVWFLLAAVAMMCVAAVAMLLLRRKPAAPAAPAPQMRFDVTAESEEIPQSDYDLDAEAAQDARADGAVEPPEMEQGQPETIEMEDLSQPEFGRVARVPQAIAATVQTPQEHHAAYQVPVKSAGAIGASVGASSSVPTPDTRYPKPAPLRHIRCPRCKTRIPIYKEGPQEVTCSACGKKGPYTPKGVGALAAASMPVPAPQPAPVYAAPEPAEETYEPPAPKARAPVKMTRCSNCGSQVPIYSTVYPVRITCPGCGRSGMYKGPRTQ